MAKTFPAHSFHCPKCSTQLRVRDRRFVNRDIHCPECHTGLHLSLTAQKEIQVELSQSVSSSSHPAAASQTGASLFTVNSIYWILSFLMLAMIGYVYVGRSETGKTSQPHNNKTIAPSVRPLQKEKGNPEQVVDSSTSPLSAEPFQAPEKPDKNEEHQVAIPAAKLVTNALQPHHMQPAFAEKPEPERAPLPEKWAPLINMPIKEYRVEGLARNKFLEELQTLAGTEFAYTDREKTTAILDQSLPVSFVLQQTSFAELLKRTLDPVGFTYELTAEKIIIKPLDLETAPPNRAP